MTLDPIDFFKSLADDTRLRILLLIYREQELCVCELTHAMGESQPKISRHLALLRSCELVADDRRGQWVYYRLHPGLPQWIVDVIDCTNTANRSWLKEQVTRLASMGDRPTRAALCC